MPFNARLTAQNLKGLSSKIENELAVYADSLKHLLLGHRTTTTLSIADSLLQIHEEAISPSIIKIKAAKANAYELLYNFEVALEIYNGLLPLLETNNFLAEEIDVLLSLARVYEFVGKPGLCEESLDKALLLIKQSDHPKKLSRYYVRAASHQRIFKDRALAKEYAAKAVALGEEHEVARSVADGNLLLGILTDDVDKSLKHFEKASTDFLALGDFIGSKNQDLNIAKKHMQSGDYERAIKILKDVDDFAETINDNERVYYQLKISLASLWERVYEIQGEHDLVISALRQNNKYTNLLGNFINQQKINQLIFDNKIREEKNKVKTITRENNFLAGTLFGLLAVIGLLAGLYFKNRSQRKEIQEQSEVIKKQYKEVQSLYNYQTTLLSEVHHRIKNNLQMIISLLTLQKAKSNKEMERDMLDILNLRVSSISLIHEQLYNTKEFDKIEVGLYAKELIDNYYVLMANEGLTIKAKVDNITLNLETVTPLGAIWSELINNSIKYNKGQSDLRIKFDLKQDGETYKMHYSDNGIGYPEGELKSKEEGMGFIIINSLSRQLAAKIESYNDNGAHYKMKFIEKIISPL